MTAYALKVFYPDEQKAREIVTLDRAGDVVAVIPQMLDRHDGCYRIRVYLNEAQLFAVDCHGNDVSD